MSIYKNTSGNVLLDYIEETGKVPKFMNAKDTHEAIRRLRSLGYKDSRDRELEELRNRQFYENN